MHMCFNATIFALHVTELREPTAHRAVCHTQSLYFIGFFFRFYFIWFFCLNLRSSERFRCRVLSSVSLRFFGFFFLYFSFGWFVVIFLARSFFFAVSCRMRHPSRYLLVRVAKIWNDDNLSQTHFNLFQINCYFHALGLYSWGVDVGVVRLHR